MDKSKLGALGVLVALGAALFFSKAQDAPAPPGDPDDAEVDAAKSASSKPAAPDAKLVGGVTDLKIEDLRPGSGPGAQNGNSLSMNYKGSLLNGEVFDQSYGRGPFEFTLGSGGVIQGWDKGILGMKVGGKRKLTIPASLGYGAAGSGEKIPGGATLIFEVELLKISKKSG